MAPRLAQGPGDLLGGWLEQVGRSAACSSRRLELRRLVSSCLVLSAPITFVVTTMSEVLARFDMPTPSSLAETVIWTWALICVLAVWIQLAVVPLVGGTLGSVRRRRRLEQLLLMRHGRQGITARGPIHARPLDDGPAPSASTTVLATLAG